MEVGFWSVRLLLFFSGALEGLQPCCTAERLPGACFISNKGAAQCFPTEPTLDSFHMCLCDILGVGFEGLKTFGGPWIWDIGCWTMYRLWLRRRLPLRILSVVKDFLLLVHDLCGLWTFWIVDNRHNQLCPASLLMWCCCFYSPASVFTVGVLVVWLMKGSQYSSSAPALPSPCVSPFYSPGPPQTMIMSCQPSSGTHSDPPIDDLLCTCDLKR